MKCISLYKHDRKWYEGRNFKGIHEVSVDILCSDPIFRVDTPLPQVQWILSAQGMRLSPSLGIALGPSEVFDQWLPKESCKTLVFCLGHWEGPPELQSALQVQHACLFSHLWVMSSFVQSCHPHVLIVVSHEHFTINLLQATLCLTLCWQRTQFKARHLNEVNI